MNTWKPREPAAATTTSRGFCPLTPEPISGFSCWRGAGSAHLLDSPERGNGAAGRLTRPDSVGVTVSKVPVENISSGCTPHENFIVHARKWLLNIPDPERLFSDLLILCPLHAPGTMVLLAQSHRSPNRCADAQPNVLASKTGITIITPTAKWGFRRHYELRSQKLRQQ